MLVKPSRLERMGISYTAASLVPLLLLHVAHVWHASHISIAITTHPHTKIRWVGGLSSGGHLRNVPGRWLDGATVGHVLLAILVDRWAGSAVASISGLHGREVVVHRWSAPVHHVLLVLQLLEVRGRHGAIRRAVHHALVVLRERWDT